MKIDATTFAKLPEHLQALFDKAPNPGRDEVLAGFPMTKSGNVKPYERENRGGWAGPTPEKSIFEREGDTGSAARFFYCAKASKKDRNAGLDGLPEKQVFGDKGGAYQGLSDSKNPDKNYHPTVKPTDLMAYLCRLVTPPGGVVLDPFMGSGSTGKAALREGFGFIGCEMSPEYMAIARARIEAALAELYV